MTQPITKAQADKRRLAEHYDWCRLHSPREYARHIVEQQQARESAAFFASDDGQSLFAEVQAFFATEEQQAQIRERNNVRVRRRFGDAYEVLGIQPGATKTQIIKAYRQKARALHPDIGGSDAEMTRLNAAYQKLRSQK